MNKVVELAEIVAGVESGSSVAFGGGGLERKPLAIAKAIGTSSTRDLHVVAFLGGPEVDLLVALGKTRLLSFAYVGFDAFGLAPSFRVAREAGDLHVHEYSESMMLAALEAGARQLPFLPARAALGTDLLQVPGTPLRTFECPVTGFDLVAVPAIEPDIAFIHVNEADPAGNGKIYGDDYADALLARSAKKVVLAAERIVESVTLTGGPSTVISRVYVDAVCVSPRGAKFTGLYPDYPIDAEAVLEYQHRASDPGWLEDFAMEEVLS